MFLRALVISLVIVFVGGCASTDTTQDVPLPQSTPTPPPMLTSGDSYYAMCGGQINDVGSILAPIVSGLESQNILYRQPPTRTASEPRNGEWRDCSGVFLRLSSAVAAVCPEQPLALVAPPGIKRYVEGGNNVSSIRPKARTSRGIAKWYQSQGRFKPIYYDGMTSPSQIPDELRQYRNLIRPGALVWFSLSRPNSADGLEGLFEKRVRRGPHINHMATVASVTRDAKNNVVSFEMFHGRSKTKSASITRKHFWKWPTFYLKCGNPDNRATCTKEYPTLGYWNQYLVGIGTLLPEPVTISAN